MPGSVWRVKATVPTDPAAVALIEALSEELAERYAVVWPSDGRTNYVPSDFDPAADAFLIGLVDGAPACCGALRRFSDDTAEVKRMYVRPEHRGRGCGRRILEALEDAAARLGYAAVVLETGTEQPEALGLYSAAGYESVAPWPPYHERPYARCFRKELA